MKATSQSPFHRGERAAQNRVGVRDMAEQLGRRMVRDYMTEQHRSFYQQLSLLFVGSVDPNGRPWASVVVGEPGFASTPDSRTLSVQSPLLAFSPLGGLKPGQQLGFLGLEFHTRRRNRMNGEVVLAAHNEFEVRVGQSFGNCPQYIQKRTLHHRDRDESTLSVGNALSTDLKNHIEASDTFFIATSFDEQGADVSHRGGKPGFVRVEDDRHLVFPDFKGNNHFNTIGNLLVNPKAGLLFFNYDNGDVLYLTTETEIVWDGPDVESVKGAQRLLCFRVVEWRLAKNSFPLAWNFQEASPVLESTGTWREPSEWNYSVEKIVQETPEIRSFYLSPLNTQAPDFKPGQHLPLLLPLSDTGQPLIRTYSLSQAPGKKDLRITVKREPNGLGSSYLHDKIEVGDHIEALSPAGNFVLDEHSQRPVVLLSAGVGITPMLSMLEHLSITQPTKEIYFVHGARNGALHALRGEVEDGRGPNTNTHFRYSQPLGNDRYDSKGRINGELLREILPFGNYDFYLCGPATFLKELHQELRTLGVPPEQIRFESFGGPVSLGKVEERNVEFRRSGTKTKWSGGSLLELAQKSGIKAPFSCRAGACGTCRANLLSGHVKHPNNPSFEVGEREALLCSAVPCSNDSDDEDLVIDL